MKDIFVNALVITLMLLLQVLFFNQINLFGYGYIFVYLIFLIVTPLSVKTIPLMLVSFVIGCTLDIFMQSYGIHTFAITLIAAIRRSLLNIFFSKEDLDYSTSLFVRFSYAYYKYVVIIVLIYCLTVFSMEAFSTKFIIPVLQKTGASTVVTTISIFFVQALTLRKYDER